MPKSNTFQKPGFWKKKSLGQNFLINTGILDKIITAAELKKDDMVIEIGPGAGNLTKKLSERVNHVIAVEKDSRLISFLREKFANSNVEIVEGDILHIGADISRSPASGKYKVIGNIPYYITSHILRAIFEQWHKPKLVVFMVQKEVAQRIVAKPPKMNLLALSVQFYAEPKIVGYIFRGSFRPMPNVDSAIIKLTILNRPLTTNSEMFFELIKAGFSEKRKKLINNLAKNFGMMKEDLLKKFEGVNIKHDIRAENLSLNQWLELVKLMEK